MNNRGQIKVADFGLALRYGDPRRRRGINSTRCHSVVRYVLNTDDTMRTKAQQRIEVVIQKQSAHLGVGALFKIGVNTRAVPYFGLKTLSVGRQRMF